MWGARCGSPAGWPAAAITAASSSSTCATAPGLVQLVFDPRTAPAAHHLAEGLRSEYVYPGPAARWSLATPIRSIRACPPARSRCASPRVELLSSARTPPFEIAVGRGHDVDEMLRLKYRYLDIRRPPMLARLELRHRAARAARDFLDAHRFLEIETPMLTRSSPEGARRLSRAFTPAAAQLLRAATVAADVQTDPHGGRRRPLLPARALLSRRKTCAPTASPSTLRSTSRCRS